ncbi:hypothetical protein CRE_12024 [Caenorhabditis remanei]|uniref:Receptor L-domain domain-containing protein n=1 Tax=Caenorhabditis remanei TaxID=31234 RepID=E3MPT9_CAERE|nr:hypothetical protein CRE_12024 [Caenorhabditis remanei]
MHMMKLSILLFLLIISYCSASFSGDLKKIIKYHQCDPLCTFNHSSISSKTIPFFPKCGEVCGLLIFDENTDLSEAQLKDVFKTMYKLNGGVRVENSHLTNLSFFTIGVEEKYFQFDCLTYGLTIQNNTKLTDVTILWKFQYWLDHDHRECKMVITDNIMLDAGKLCYYGYFYISINMRVTGNLKDCGCRGGNSTTVALSQLSDCDLILSGLKLINTSDTSPLSNITQIRGNLLIQHTNFQNLSFFKNLETLKISTPGLHETIAIDIKDNPQMTRFGIPLLKEFPNIWQGYLFMNLENLHPDFCLTIEEMTLFLKSEVLFVNIHAKYCTNPGNLNGAKLCEFSTMKALEKYCNYILGDVKIESGDEKHVEKLSDVTVILGTLEITNTTLKDLNFLAGLSYMASLSESTPIIQLISNKNLKTAYLSSMKNIITKTENYAIIHNNHPSLIYEGFELYHSIYTSSPEYFGGRLGTVTHFSHLIKNVFLTGCPSDKISSLGWKFYETCTVLSRGLNLVNVTVPQGDINSFNNIKTINGQIEIAYTDLEDLSFLENVKNIEVMDYLNYGGIMINIHHNPNMKRLGLEALKKLFSIVTFTINLEKLHPDFCLTIQEMIVFLDFQVDFLNIDAKICKMDFETKNSKAVCLFKDMLSLEPKCNYIIGDLVISHGDEDYTEKLKSVAIIFGSLAIQDTDLDNLEFLEKLRKIANFNESIPIIKIVNNKDLKNLHLNFPIVQGTISKGFPRAIIEGDDIFETTKDCMIFQYNTRTNVTYNGGSCSKIHGLRI